MKLIEDITMELGRNASQAVEEAIKELLSCCVNIKPEEMNGSNIEQIRSEMTRKGYEIQHYMQDGDSCYKLMQGGKPITGFRVHTEFKLEEGRGTIKIMKQILQ